MTRMVLFTALSIPFYWSLFTPHVFAGEYLRFQSGVVTLETLPGRKHEVRRLGGKTADSSPTHYFILQYKNSISASDQHQLRSHQIEVLRYIPDDAYIVRASEGKLKTLAAQNAAVRGFIVYSPEVRVSSGLKLRHVFEQNRLETIRLHLFHGVDSRAFAEKLAKNGYIVEGHSAATVVLTVPLHMVGALASQEGVEWVSKKPQMKLRAFPRPPTRIAETSTLSPVDDEDEILAARGNFSDLTGYESGTKIMNFEKAWSKGYRGRGQVVGISDTGLDTGETRPLAADFSNLYQSFALGYGSTSWADYMGHGTHVAGSVGGTGADSKGKILGGAHEAHLVVQSLWSKDYNTLTLPENLGDVFAQAYSVGAKIHTNSWGNPEAMGIYDMEASQVDQFMWDHPDMLVLFAAGNDGVDADKDGRIDPGAVSSPATAKNILSVGASENLVIRGGIQMKLGEIAFGPGQIPWPVEPLASDTLSNNPQGIVAFSSRGPTKDGRIKPDVVAPGSNILSNCSHMKDADELWGRYNIDYCYSGGTSMSAPLAAGAAAVIRERLVSDSSRFNGPSAALIKAIMLHTAEDLYPGQYGEIGIENGQELLEPGPNFDQGYGRVDVGRAVTKEMRLIDDKVGLATGESRQYKVRELIQKVTLVYTDAPGGPQSEQALVNNLDLEVEVDGQIHTSSSAVNNTEQVILKKPTSGVVYVRVRGVSVPIGKEEGRQPYAVVFSAL